MRSNNKFMERSIDILERIIEFKIGLNDWEWTDYLSGKPDGFDNMGCKEKLPLIDNMIYKLDLMLNDPVNTLYDWIWLHKHLGETFDEFMTFKINKLPDSPMQATSFKERMKKIFA